ncbi:hypothetical protein [Yimella sp. cx-51]|uniref:hypothetical protein n=1 Tax=Yimella sp. cx-51 TaxID=2770551 RepID=UPI00165DE4E0|nr:hypothetical protein [Yimella sp. cx-51]MBC9955464.1 hypothetical protein [Yimella sp. cx-51]MBD2759530.1 hypothetical protein [Yimella sp. cx-573]QTH37949.1 hypothetical protein J5M86_14090 [Yimella sp. cx-51]
MDDSALDQLLLGSRPDVDERALRGAQELADAIARQHRPRPRRISPRRKIFAALGVGALALTGAGSLAAYQLSIPPFVTIPDGESLSTAHS